ncbi:MAG: DUF2378 family protein [Polyangiaceae bacterium]
METVLNRESPSIDLARRLRDLPRSAMVRGVFFSMLRDEVERRALLSVRELAEILRNRDAWRLYPASELMTAYATTATLLHRDPNEGLRILFASMPASYVKTWYGGIFRKFLLGEPERALRYVEKAREQLASYGTWRLETMGPRHVVFQMTDEFFWIDTAQRGGCEGLLEICGVEGEVRATLDGRYRGALDITWRPKLTD